MKSVGHVNSSSRGIFVYHGHWRYFFGSRMVNRFILFFFFARGGVGDVNYGLFS